MPRLCEFPGRIHVKLNARERIPQSGTQYSLGVFFLPCQLTYSPGEDRADQKKAYIFFPKMLDKSSNCVIILLY